MCGDRKQARPPLGGRVISTDKGKTTSEYNWFPSLIFAHDSRPRDSRRLNTPVTALTACSDNLFKQPMKWQRTWNLTLVPYLKVRPTNQWEEWVTSQLWCTRRLPASALNDYTVLTHRLVLTIQRDCASHQRINNVISSSYAGLFISNFTPIKRRLLETKRLNAARMLNV